MRTNASEARRIRGDFGDGGTAAINDKGDDGEKDKGDVDALDAEEEQEERDLAEQIAQVEAIYARDHQRRTTSSSRSSSGYQSVAEIESEIARLERILQRFDDDEVTPEVISLAVSGDAGVRDEAASILQQQQDNTSDDYDPK